MRKAGLEKRATRTVGRAPLVAYRALSDLAGKGSFFLITVVAAHRLSRPSFGVFALVTTLGWIVGVATDFGIQLHLARTVARQIAGGWQVLRSWLTVRLWMSGGAICAVAVGSIAWERSRAYWSPILLFALVYVGSGLIEFLYYFFRGLSRSDLESSLTIAQRLSTLVLSLAVLTWRPTLPWLAGAMLLPVMATLLVAASLAARLGRALGPRENAAPDENAHRWRVFKRDVLPIGAGVVLSALYFRIDVFLVEIWRGTESVALYNAVFRLVEALRLFPAAVLAVELPRLCRAADQRALVGVSVAVTGFALAAAVALSAAANWGITLVYGTAFAQAVPAFRILLLAFPLMSLNYALTHQLIAWDAQKAYAVICGVALIANVAINVWLIPAFGIEGAAWATLWTEVVLTSGCALALWARVPRRTPDPATLTIAS